MTLEQHLAYFTEIQLATVEDLRARHSAGRFPKGELARHQRIADAMVAVCVETQIQPYRQPRLYERLKALGVTCLREDR